MAGPASLGNSDGAAPFRLIDNAPEIHPVQVRIGEDYTEARFFREKESSLEGNQGVSISALTMVNRFRSATLHLHSGGRTLRRQARNRPRVERMDEESGYHLYP